MLDVELSVRNYRCFGDEPATIRISDGFTALVGVNNSGKSSLLRVLYEIRPLIVILSKQGSRNRPDELNFQLGETIEDLFAPQILHGERILRSGTEKPAEISFVIHDGPMGPFTYGNDLLKAVVTHSFDQERNCFWSRLEIKTSNGASFPGALTELDYNAPALWAAMEVLADTMYIGPFRNALHIGAQERYYDIATGDAFIKTFDEYKSGGDPQRNEAVYNLTQELRRIFDFESLEINATPGKNSMQILVDGRSYRLTELGAGLAHFIVVLVNVLVRKPSILLIDEPELNLHASLQLDFLTTLGRNTEHNVTFATHSIGLARTSADRIYTLTKPSGTTSRVRSYESDPELITLLGQLAFDTRPDLGFSKILLVEGKTEVRAIMQLLRRYKKEHQVLLLPLHGGEMISPEVRTELTELLRIGGEVKYLIDSERSDRNDPLSRKRQGFVDLCADLGIQGLVLEYRTLENYFPQRAIDRVHGKGFLALSPYEKKGQNQGWPKAGNWKIAAEMRSEDLSGTDLGDFLSGL